MTNMIMIGFMGAGKTTISHKVGRLLACDSFDLDQLLAKELGESIETIFETKGETYFREQEYRFLKRYQHQPGIISTGGGIVTYEPSLALLKKCEQVVYLEASFETLYNRLLSDDTQHRPLLKGQPKQKVEELFVIRQAMYREAATHTIVTDQLTVADIANYLIEL